MRPTTEESLVTIDVEAELQKPAITQDTYFDDDDDLSSQQSAAYGETENTIETHEIKIKVSYSQYHQLKEYVDIDEDGAFELPEKIKSSLLIHLQNELERNQMLTQRQKS